MDSLVTEHVLIFRDIAMAFAGALVCGFLAWRIRQPILLGYVLAGLILSPLTPGLRVHDVHVFQIMAEAGVVLLMFSVGIEFSIPDLLRVKWVAVGLGVGAGTLMGWPLLQSIAVGSMISVASTMVLIKLLMDRGRLGTNSGRVMVTLTLVEDLFVIILTVVLPGLSAGSAAGYGQVAWKIGKALLLLIPIVLAAWKLMPWILDKAEKTYNDELS